MKLIRNKSGFTLVEMLIVLIIVSVLSLLIVPNIGQTTDKVNTDAKYALTQVIQTQAGLYKLEANESATMEALVSGKYITQQQADKAVEWEISLP